ncbi:MAG TPA: hypothetical protein VL633_11240 [Bacteroidota bacterium]|jgi:hypothetical protein|nr:hypothetical protein [Bacteroidota bacterium]
MKKLLLILFLFIQIASGQQSPHGAISIACEVCHSTSSWQVRTDAEFNHNSTGFPLTGKHRFTLCSSCHQKLQFSNTSQECASCHTDAHQQELGTACARCHTTETWLISDMKQRHQQTRFPLVGAHAFVSCDQCHTRASSHRYAGTPLTCIACHTSDFQATTAPSHTVQGFPVDCNTCHRIDAPHWPGGFDHALTAFPLTGAHKATVCLDCHTGNRFTKLPTICYSCHSADFASTQAPNHSTGGFSHDCITCHTTAAWQPSTFDHSATAFPLTGKHLTAQCQECHANGNYQLHYTDCYQCHSGNFQQTVNPNHVSGNFSHDCMTCHTTSAWTPASFNHASTAFPLTGKHATTECAGCHTNGNYQLTYSSCYQCHQGNFETTINPNHVSGNFGHDCQTCHTTIAWSPAAFDHSITAFPLTGKHTATQCSACHTNGNYQIQFTNCYQCHQADYQRPTDPNHVAANFDHNCQTCHTTTAWIPSTFNHDQQYFRIYSGRHQGLWTSCGNCHQDNTNYSAFTCLTCHAPTETNSHHTGVSGYTYSSPACYSCHRGV